MLRSPVTFAATVGSAAALIFSAQAGAALKAGAPPPLWTHGAFSTSPQHLALAIRPAPGPLSRLDWRTGIVRTAPDERVSNSNFAVRPGDPVTVTVVNYTAEAHTFTAPELGVGVLIRAGSAARPSRTVFTFTAPRFGTFRWFCARPCGGYMGGNVYAIIKV